jgi:hypothetical protein
MRGSLVADESAEEVVRYMEAWFRSRPDSVVRRFIESPAGDALYRMKSTGHLVLIYSYGEAADGSCPSCVVLVLREHNPNVITERRVFGIAFEDLEPVSIGPRATLGREIAERILRSREN